MAIYFFGKNVPQISKMSPKIPKCSPNLVSNFFPALIYRVISRVKNRVISRLIYRMIYRVISRMIYRDICRKQYSYNRSVSFPDPSQAAGTLGHVVTCYTLHMTKYSSFLKLDLIFFLNH